jgi:bifunctional UDP-N-acetylglucosamine pyrophosphorylase/glucosamine-1-phosphate N-acetyltransferase
LDLKRVLVVVGHQAEKVEQALAGRRVETVYQAEPLGTGHALLQTRDALSDFKGALLVLNGDSPLIREETLDAVLNSHTRRGSGVTLLTAVVADPTGYGRIIRDRSRRVVKIVEEKDATAKERLIPEINTGVYAFEAPLIFDLLSRLRPDNAQKEFYLPDVVRAAIARKVKVFALAAPDPAEVLGINSRAELAAAEREIQRRIAERWMAEGVSLPRPDEVLIGAEVKIGPDTILYSGAVLEGKSAIGERCTIRASRIVDSTLQDNVTVNDYCVIEESLIESGVTVGPFAHLRPGSLLRRGSRVGNFVELKKAEMGEGAKANHLSYIGDATVGRGTNIGAGTITCNYDGEKKHRTVIGEEVFVGSDTQFVAPVTIGDGAIIAAGSTITEDVPKDSLAVARSRQVNKEGWAKKRKNRSSR